MCPVLHRRKFRWPSRCDFVGQCHDEDLVGRVASAVDGETGVRLVAGAPTVIAAQKPYTWQVAREGTAIRIEGFVPDEA